MAAGAVRDLYPRAAGETCFKGNKLYDQGDGRAIPIRVLAECETDSMGFRSNSRGCRRAARAIPLTALSPAITGCLADP